MSDQKNKKNIESNQKYTPPEYKKKAFHCPHCEVYANQNWKNIVSEDREYVYMNMDDWLLRTARRYNLNTMNESILQKIIKVYSSLFIGGIELALCARCKKYSIWVDGQMVYPNMLTAPLPIEEMPESVKKLYNEAREISGKSPRGACALLRLAVQQLVKELGEDENNLSKAIGNLVQKGLPKRIQEALDSVRVIGNNAVHPGKINIEDKPEITDTLFMLINFISEKMFKDEQKVEKIFSSLPKNSKKATEQRDQK